MAYLLFRFFPKKIKIIDIVLVALFTVLKMVLQVISINIPLFGFPSLRIGVSQLPLMVGGFVLGPVLGFILGLVVDIVGLMVSPTDFPFLGFTLGNILMAVLPALVREFYNKISSDKKEENNENVVDQKKDSPKVLYGLLVGIWVINCIALLSTKEIKFSSDVTVIMKPYARAIMLTTIVTLLLIIVLIYKLTVKKIKVKDKLYEVWFSGVIVSKLIVNVVLTSYWLEVMYGIPFFASSAIRLITMTVLVNVEGFLGYLLLVLLKRVLKEKTTTDL